MLHFKYVSEKKRDDKTILRNKAGFVVYVHEEAEKKNIRISTVTKFTVIKIITFLAKQIRC